MPVRFEYLPDRKLMLSQLIGNATEEEQIELVLRAHKLRDGVAYYDSIIDMSQLTHTDMNGAEMFSQASRIQRSLEGMTRPLRQAVIGATSYSFGIARMYAGFADFQPGMEVKVFASMREGMDWLDVIDDEEALFANRNWESFSSSDA